MPETNPPPPPPSLPLPRPRSHQTLSVRAARNLAHPTKTVPQMASVTPRWLLNLLPWVNVQAGTYVVNRRKVVTRSGQRVATRIEGETARLDRNALRGLPLLRDADDTLLEMIASLLVNERHDANAVLYKEGEPGKKVFIVAKGKVEITTTDPHGEKLRVALRGDGDHFGEKVLLSDGPRTTTARTLTPSLFLTFERAKFQAKLQASPELRLAWERVVRQVAEDGGRSNESGEAGIEISSYHDGEPELTRTFVDYEEVPREYPLSVMQTIIRLHTRITDLYNNPIDQLREQLRLTIEGMKERQEQGIINDPEFGLLHAASPAQRIRTRSGPPTPDDMDDLLARVWKEPAFFLAHPRAIAAFGRECTRRGVPPPTVQMFGSPFLTWRGVPIVPSDKLAVDGIVTDRSAGLTNILLMRVGESRQGVVGLNQIGLPGEQFPGLSVRFMGIDNQSTASYLVTMYYSAAVLTEDALGVLENVEVGNYHDYNAR